MYKKIDYHIMEDNDYVIILACHSAMNPNERFVGSLARYFPYRTEYFKNVFIIFNTEYSKIKDICDKLMNYMEK